MHLPFRLEEGIFFEDSGNVLTWGDKLENIKKIDNPSILENGKLIIWTKKICFGGLKLNLTLRVDNYHNAHGKFDFIDLEEEKKEPHGAYKKHSLVFREILGEPTETHIDFYDYKTDLWTISDIQIILGVGERFVDYEIFGIHKGEKFWSLKERNEK